ncbi:MAG: transglutaminase-like cysteine peptidase [Candidatus Odyssella sp.]|nr:transglutaminase-like cysteine peptidase [Candidatus Odyssella sp.]
MRGAKTGSTRRQWRRAVPAAMAALAIAVAGEAALARTGPAPERAAPVLPADLFGVGEIAHPPAAGFAKWTETMARYARERGREKALCEAGDCALSRWREFLETLRGRDAPAQLRAVNAYFNRLPYRTDLENYGVEDYWATPRELFARGGDCEDYAIAKFLSLRALGWPAERLRVAVVHDNARDLVHAALIAYHGGNAWVLDIEIAEVTEHRAIARYVPIFAISENGWWSYAAPSAAEAAAALAKAAERPRERERAVAAEPPRSPHLRHKPARAARLAARAPRPIEAWRALHLKHAPPRVAQAPPAFDAVLRAATSPARTPPAPAATRENEREDVALPGERLEEMFRPGGK